MDRRLQKHDTIATHAHEERALRWHEACRGKLDMFPKCPVRGHEDFAVWYTPGVPTAATQWRFSRMGVVCLG